jgi:hypothetical protein
VVAADPGAAAGARGGARGGGGEAGGGARACGACGACGSGLLRVLSAPWERGDQGGSNGGKIIGIGGVLAEI